MDRRGANVGSTRDIDPEGIGPECSPPLFRKLDVHHGTHEGCDAANISHRVSISRPDADGHPGQPAARWARHRRPTGSTSSLICRHGTAVWLVLSEPCDGEIYAEIPLDPLLQSHRRPLARPGRRPARGVLLRLPGRRPRGQRPSLRSREHPARPVRAGALVRPALGDRRRPAPAQPDDRIDDRSRRASSIRARRWKTRSSTSCTCAATRSTRARASSIPGTYRGLVEKIDYLKELGITAVELLPVDEFDENDCPFVNPLTGEKLRNFWGYNPIAFCAPKAAYAHNPERVGAVGRVLRDGRRVP